MKEAIHIMYLKVQNYKQLEVSIKKEENKIAAKWVNEWANEMAIIRECYSEILI